MRIRFLGTGTSTGVPQLGCTCSVCTSTDVHDKRMRTSALVTTDNGTNLLIDCGPDFYHQLLAAGAPPIDALLITHIHYDHVGGMDDLRPYCKGGRAFPVYCRADVEKGLRHNQPYSFAKNKYPGVPTYDINNITEGVPFTVAGTTVLPVAVKHYLLDILGFRIDRLGYVTDCKVLPDESVEALKGVDTLVINALRIEEHLSHINLEQALELIARISPRQAYLTHICHQLGRSRDVEAMLPPNVHLAYDNLEIAL